MPLPTPLILTDCTVLLFLLLLLLLLLFLLFLLLLLLLFLLLLLLLLLFLLLLLPLLLYLLLLLLLLLFLPTACLVMPLPLFPDVLAARPLLRHGTPVRVFTQITSAHKHLQPAITQQ